MAKMTPLEEKWSAGFAAGQHSAYRNLAGALRKFAPDLATELVVRHTEARGALENLLWILRNEEKSPIAPPSEEP